MSDAHAFHYPPLGSVRIRPECKRADVVAIVSREGNRPGVVLRPQRAAPMAIPEYDRRQLAGDRSTSIPQEKRGRSKTADLVVT